MSTGTHLVDPAISKKHIDQSIDALMKRVTVNTEFWIPYLAGYSIDWKNQPPTVFHDPRLPERLPYPGSAVNGETTIDVMRYLLIHECTEKCLMDELGMPYILAHNLATAAEKTAVEADGYSWDIYTNLLTPYIKLVETKPDDLTSPANLDTRPYVQEHFSGLSEMSTEGFQGCFRHRHATPSVTSQAINPLDRKHYPLYGW